MVEYVYSQAIVLKQCRVELSDTVHHAMGKGHANGLAPLMEFTQHEPHVVLTDSYVLSGWSHQHVVNILGIRADVVPVDSVMLSVKDRREVC